MSSILIIDDEPNIRRMLASLLRAEGYRVREAGGAAAGVEEILFEEPDALLMDLVMPGEGGLEALPKIRESAPELPVIMMSGKASLSDAVHATKLGAFHFLEKPLSPEAVLLTLRSALELRQAREINRALREELGEGDEMIGKSAALEKVLALIERVAPTDARVLITGEPGTGKELVAAAIHRRSERADGPFIRVNCAAIPRDLVESEMFGHERGAFTGATERRRGRFELADGGILFLDEVGDLEPDAQAKLLRALEAGVIERVGGGEPIPVDVRVITATNKDLRAESAAGRFREDLYFRLNVIPIHLPALRERVDDIPPLVQHFIQKHRTRNALRPPRMTDAALEALAGHRWPGNVRELANIVERLMILHPGRAVNAEDVHATLATGAPNTDAGDGYAEDDGATLTERLDDFERRVIADALNSAEGNVTEAARRLHTDRANLYRRMRRLDLRL